MKQWQSIMAAEEKRTGLPAGMLASLVQQETGGQQRFVDNPSDFHYKAGPNGEKPKSTARGLGGILEGTARDPGYGVAPLKDWSVPEQLRFMADYSQARIKQAGSVQAGLAGYGKGGKYSAQVMARLEKQAAPAPVVQPVRESLAVGESLVENPTVVNLQQEVVAPVQMAARPAPLAEVDLMNKAPVQATPQWDAFQMASAQQIAPQMLDYGRKQLATMPVQQPDFSRFKGWGARA